MGPLLLLAVVAYALSQQSTPAPAKKKQAGASGGRSRWDSIESDSRTQEFIQEAGTVGAACLKGAMVGGTAGAPAAGATGGLSVVVGAGGGCVVGALIEVFGEGNERVVEGPTQIAGSDDPWPPTWMGHPIGRRDDTDDELFWKVVEVSDGRETQRQVVVFGESYWLQFDYEVGRWVA